MLRKEKLCGEEQGQDADTCRWTMFHTHSIPAQAGCAADVIRMPVLWDLRNQGLLSSIAFWLHTYCLEIWFPPQFGPKCKNEIYFRAMWFHFFCIWVYGMNSVRTTAFPKEVSKSILSLTIRYWNGNTNKAVLISFFRDIIGEKTSPLSI